MSAQSRVSQDRRGGSRVIALAECHLKYKDKDYDAVIVDLSSRGAMITASCVPALHDEVKINLRSKYVLRELNLTGKVLRSGEAMTEYGKKGRFVVRFLESPLDLVLLIGKLYSSK